jgi:hypothetical protein
MLAGRGRISVLVPGPERAPGAEEATGDAAEPHAFQVVSRRLPCRVKLSCVDSGTLASTTSTGLKIRVTAVRFRPWPLKLENKLVRRTLALLTTLCMLHFTVAAGVSLCATHAHHEVAQSANPTAPSQPMDGHDESANSEEHDCDAPVLPHCCGVISSCAISFSPGNPTDTHDPVTAGQPVRIGAADVPASVVNAPDPPPPKA